MNAEEARNLTKKAHDDPDSKVGKAIQTIEAQVERAANDGFSSIDISQLMLPHPLRTPIIEKLKEKGFKVNDWSDQRDNTHGTSISW